MTRRGRYAAAAAVLFVVEVLIALFVRDAFVRPYGGDILVTVLLCCLVRALSPKTVPHLPVLVFTFAVSVELLQAAGIASLIPAGWTVVRIAVGGVFSWGDLLCYALGAFLFFLCERTAGRLRSGKKQGQNR